jgi:mono/diheme cytochrome c family protein
LLRGAVPSLGWWVLEVSGDIWSKGDLLMTRAVLGFSALAAAVLIGELVSAQMDSALIPRGEKVYMEKKCAVCHQVKGKGGKAGPDLSTVGAKRDAPWLKAFMKDPKATNPKSKMMSFKGNDEELEALVSYLVSLK